MLTERLTLAPVRQIFNRHKINDVAEALKTKMLRLTGSVSKGMSVAITAGSRGINNIPIILKSVVDILKDMGAKPYIVSAMGSHGGGTAEGQLKVLEHLGITENFLGVPLRITEDATLVGITTTGHKLFIDSEAFKADSILLVNRVKPHTAFQDRLASGLYKMLTVGLGKVPGATQVHSLSSAGMYEAILQMGRLGLNKLPILGGIAIVENSYEETSEIEVLLPHEIEEAEMRLLSIANDMLPRLPLNNLDVLIVEEMGKNFSGTGMDTNVIGRWKATGIEEPKSPKIKRVVVLRLSKESHGNANGIGLADVTTSRLVSKIDWESTLMNVRTTGFWDRAFCPPFPGNDYDAIEWALRGMKITGTEDLKIAIISNTLHLEHLWLNRPAFECSTRCELLGEYTPLCFDKRGNLIMSRGKTKDAKIYRTR